jgi:protein-disulfide isomerase
VLKDSAGRVRLIFKDRPLAIHPGARAAHEAARCAGAQGRYWEYHDRLFTGQQAFGHENLLAHASALGLDRGAFARCVEERRFGPDVEADVDQAAALGVFATPTLFVNGRRVEGLVPLEELRSIIEEALEAASKERR